MLKEIRIHGRGGQGAVSLAKLIALAAYYEGFSVQAFPSFGVERRGAPIESYVRISDKKINRRDHIENPDLLIIIDETLLSKGGILNGLDNGDMVLINSTRSEDELRKFFAIYPDVKIKSIDAISLALDILGKPIVNTALLVGFSFLTGLFSLDSAKRSIKEVFGDKGGDIVAKNIKLAEKANDHFDPHKQFVVVPGEMGLMVVKK